MYIPHHLWEPNLYPLFIFYCVPRQSRETTRCSTASSISWNYPMLSCLVNFVKLSDAQLPRQSRETIRCSAASSILWTIRCSGASSVFWNYLMLNCLVKSRETIRCSAASSVSWNYPMLSCLVNLLKLSDAEQKKGPALPRAHCKDTNIPRNETARPHSQCLHSCIWERYIFPQSVCLFCCSKIGGPLLSERDRTWKEI